MVRNSIIVFIIITLGIAAYFLVGRRDKENAQTTQVPAQSEVLSYVALGDSYTIGQGVKESERWPNQLIKKLESDGLKLSIDANPSRTGYTTQDLLDQEISVLSKAKPDFVTVQIGVNDFFRGVDKQTFKSNFIRVIEAVKDNAVGAKILIVTIPDYGKTPAGANTGSPEKIATGIIEFNDIIKAVAADYSLPVADVYAISQMSSAEQKVASDGLHPSGAQYTDWLTAIYPAAKDALKD